MDKIYCLLVSLQQLLELLHRGSEGGEPVVVVEEDGALDGKEVGRESSGGFEERSRSEDGVGGEVTGVEVSEERMVSEVPSDDHTGLSLVMEEGGLHHGGESVGELLQSGAVQLEDLLSLLGVLSAVEDPAQSEQVHGGH